MSRGATRFNLPKDIKMNNSFLSLAHTKLKQLTMDDER